MFTTVVGSRIILGRANVNEPFILWHSPYRQCSRCETTKEVQFLIVHQIILNRKLHVSVSLGQTVGRIVT
jgi:hypothetical protein